MLACFLLRSFCHPCQVQTLLGSFSSTRVHCSRANQKNPYSDFLGSLPVAGCTTISILSGSNNSNFCPCNRKLQTSQQDFSPGLFDVAATSQDSAWTQYISHKAGTKPAGAVINAAQVWSNISSVVTLCPMKSYFLSSPHNIQEDTWLNPLLERVLCFSYNLKIQRIV